MRFMMVVIRKGFETAAADAAPGAEAVARMMEYNKSLHSVYQSLPLLGLLTACPCRHHPPTLEPHFRNTHQPTQVPQGSSI